MVVPKSTPKDGSCFMSFLAFFLSCLLYIRQGAFVWVRKASPSFIHVHPLLFTLLCFQRLTSSTCAFSNTWWHNCHRDVVRRTWSCGPDNDRNWRTRRRRSRCGARQRRRHRSCYCCCCCCSCGDDDSVKQGLQSLDALFRRSCETATTRSILGTQCVWVCVAWLLFFDRVDDNLFCQRFSAIVRRVTPKQESKRELCDVREEGHRNTTPT